MSLFLSWLLLKSRSNNGLIAGASEVEADVAAADSPPHDGEQHKAEGNDAKTDTLEPIADVLDPNAEIMDKKPEDGEPNAESSDEQNPEKAVQGNGKGVGKESK